MKHVNETSDLQVKTSTTRRYIAASASLYYIKIFITSWLWLERKWCFCIDVTANLYSSYTVNKHCRKTSLLSFRVSSASPRGSDTHVSCTVYNQVCVWWLWSVSGISSTGSVARAAGACSLMIWPPASLQLSVNITREECVRMETDAGELLRLMHNACIWVLMMLQSCIWVLMMLQSCIWVLMMLQKVILSSCNLALNLRWKLTRLPPPLYKIVNIHHDI